MRRFRRCVANDRLRHLLIGDASVSKADGSQSLDLPRDALRVAGVDAGHVYHDVASGVRDDRPGLDSCVRALRPGDVLVVWKLDRTIAHLVNIVHWGAPHGGHSPPPPIQLITGLVEPFSACLSPKMNRPTAWYYLSGCTYLIRATCT